MNKMCMMLLVSLALVAAPLSAEGAEIDLGVEVGTGELLAEDADFELYVKPFVDLTLGETGFVVGASWEVPVVPDLYKGILEAYGEYGFSVSPFDFTAGVDVSYGLEAEEDDPGSYVYGIVDYALPFGLGLEAELDFTFLPDIYLDAMAGAIYELDLGPGCLGLEAYLNFSLYDEAGLGDTELVIYYSLPAGPVELTFEADPVLTTGADEVELQLSALAGVTFSF